MDPYSAQEVDNIFVGNSMLKIGFFHDIGSDYFRETQICKQINTLRSVYAKQVSIDILGGKPQLELN